MQFRRHLIAVWNSKTQLTREIKIAPNDFAVRLNGGKRGKPCCAEDLDDVALQHWFSRSQADLVESHLDRGLDAACTCDVSGDTFTNRIFDVALEIEAVGLARHRG